MIRRYNHDHILNMVTSFNIPKCLRLRQLLFSHSLSQVIEWDNVKLINYWLHHPLLNETNAYHHYQYRHHSFIFSGLGSTRNIYKTKITMRLIVWNFLLVKKK